MATFQHADIYKNPYNKCVSFKHIHTPIIYLINFCQSVKYILSNFSNYFKKTTLKSHLPPTDRNEPADYTEI